MFSFDSIEVSSSVVAVVATDADGNAAADGKFSVMFVVEAAPYLASVFWGEDEGRIEGGAADKGGAADCSILSTAVSAGLADDVGRDVDAGGTISIVDGAVVSAVAEIVLESGGATGGGGAIDGGGGGRGALAGREKVGAGAPPAKADDARKSISISISIWGAGGGGNAIGGKGRP